MTTPSQEAYEEQMVDKVVCPACHQVVPNRAHIRQGKAPSEYMGGRVIGVISIGFQCKLCGHTWGHALPEGWVENPQ